MGLSSIVFFLTTTNVKQTGIGMYRKAIGTYQKAEIILKLGT
jgi:hypothetical protein